MTLSSVVLSRSSSERSGSGPSEAQRRTEAKMAQKKTPDDNKVRVHFEIPPWAAVLAVACAIAFILLSLGVWRLG
jgi:hypothetical protein